MWSMDGEGVCSGSTVSCTVKIYRSFSVLTIPLSLCFFSYQSCVKSTLERRTVDIRGVQTPAW